MHSQTILSCVDACAIFPRFSPLHAVVEMSDINDSNEFDQIDDSDNEQIVYEDSETGSDDLSAILQGILEQQVATNKVQAENARIL